jgi:polygalacturonase
VAFDDHFAPWTFHEFEEDGEWNEPITAAEWPLSLPDLCINNTRAFNKAIKDAQPGDTVVIPDGHSFTLTGGLLLNDKHNITLDFAGTSHFAYDLSIWPYASEPPKVRDVYDPALTIFNSTGITVTSSSRKLAQVTVDYNKNMVYLVNSKEYRGGILNGYGKQWWDDAISGRIKESSRPRLIHVTESTDLKIEHLTLVNSPFWTLTVEAVRAEISHVNVLVDRRYQTSLMKDGPLLTQSAEKQRLLGDENVDFPFPIDDLPDWVGRKLRQPEDLNTDGIDPSGKDIWIHHCIVQNADDSIAVKPLRRRDFVTNMPNCTTNVTIEHTVLTGFGASIGSVGPSPAHSCVDGVRFHNIR